MHLRFLLVLTYFQAICCRKLKLRTIIPLGQGLPLRSCPLRFTLHPPPHPLPPITPRILLPRNRLPPLASRTTQPEQARRLGPLLRNELPPLPSPPVLSVSASREKGAHNQGEGAKVGIKRLLMGIAGGEEAEMEMLTLTVREMMAVEDREAGVHFSSLFPAEPAASEAREQGMRRV